MTLPAAKAEWRTRLLRARKRRSAADRAAAQAAITTNLLAALDELGRGARLTVCLYLPLPSEPLAPDAPFVAAHAAHRVMVPVTTSGAPLDWCELPGIGDALSTDAAIPHTASGAGFSTGALGVPEPLGPRLGPRAILGADVVIVPALATDPAGFRLGRGGGFYDRSLALLGGAGRPPKQGVGANMPGDSVIPVPPRIAVIFDDEADLPIPHETHDARVSHVLTPALGLRGLA